MRHTLPTIADDGGGIINFVMSKGRVGFNIDMAAAHTARIAIGSKLSALAVDRRRSPA